MGGRCETARAQYRLRPGEQVYSGFFAASAIRARGIRHRSRVVGGCDKSRRSGFWRGRTNPELRAGTGGEQGDATGEKRGEQEEAGCFHDELSFRIGRREMRGANHHYTRRRKNPRKIFQGFLPRKGYTL